VRDLEAKEADEEADAPQPVSRIMVILKAPERREWRPARLPKAISSRRRERLAPLASGSRGLVLSHRYTCICAWLCVTNSL